MIKRGLLVALMLLSSLAVFSAQQPAAEKSVYVVTIIDVIPLPGGLGSVDALLRQFASVCRVTLADSGQLRSTSASAFAALSSGAVFLGIQPVVYVVELRVGVRAALLRFVADAAVRTCLVHFILGRVPRAFNRLHGLVIA